MSADLALGLGLGIPFILLAFAALATHDDDPLGIYGLFKKRNNPVVVNFSTGQIVGTIPRKNRKSRKNMRKQ
jgi:hypothetical protein